ncbi:MAG: hypothetical protein OEV76_04245 [Anaerolineae bacterium]|nr:hypothetical protein [Anaerolineae bacterium]
MTEGSNQRPVWAGHQLYREAMTRSEAQEWEEAASILSELAGEFPGDPELEQILASLRLKASLGQEQPPKGRSRLRGAWRRAVAGGGILALVILMAALAYSIYARWLQPAWMARDQAIHVRELHQLAKGYMTAGEYDRAVSLYKEILDQVPDDNVALAGLHRAEQLRSLADEYDGALSLTQEERWWEALWAWRLILAQDPNFRDADYWLAFVERQDTLGQLLQEAEMRYAAGDWDEALASIKNLRSQSAEFQQEQVETLLAASSARLAEQRLWEADDPLTLREEVLELFDDAVQIRPGDQSLLAEAQVAEVYLDTYARLQPDCEEQLKKLHTVYDPEAGSSPDQQFLLLYQVNVGCGDERAEARDFQGAQSCYLAAAEMPIDDVAEAGDKYVALIPMLTPTATATPRPPTPIPTPRPATATPTHTATVSPWRFALLGGPAHQGNTKYPAWGCGWLGVGGQVLDAAGGGLDGIKVRVWSGSYEFPLVTSGGKWTALYGPGGWEVYLNSWPTEGTWNCQLVGESGVGLSPVVLFNTYAGDCSRNLVLINFKQNY